MRFLLEIIFCIGAAYGIAWFLSNYGERMAARPGAFDGLNGNKENRGVLTLAGPGVKKQVQPAESAATLRPVRDKRWLS